MALTCELPPWSRALVVLLTFTLALASHSSPVRRQVSFTVVPGLRIVSGVDPLGSVSRPAMTNILCAALCRTNSDCDCYQFSPVSNECHLSRGPTNVTALSLLDVVPDQDWSAAFIPPFSTQESGAWTMVFRAQSRVGVPVYQTWLNSSLQHDLDPHTNDFPEACLRLTDYGLCDRHFRSHILDNWENIHEVRFSLVKSDMEVAYIVFDGTDSDSMSWFSHSRVLHSTWSPQLDTDHDLLPLSIKGVCTVHSCRRFLVWENYHLCNSEFFYTATLDQTYELCNTGTLNWETLLNLTSVPVFLFSPGPGRGSMGINRGDYPLGHEADVMSVWVKFV